MTEQTLPEVARVQVVEDVTSDYLLPLLASLAQENGLQMGITLNVSGQLISGQLIGRDEWFRAITEQAQQASQTGGDVMEALAYAARRMAGLEEEREGDDPASSDGETPTDEGPGQYGFMHLRDAVVWFGNVPVKKLMWRVRISEVSAWMVGQAAVA